MIFGHLRKFLGEIFYESASRKGAEILEGHMMRDHIHLSCLIPITMPGLMIEKDSICS
ncbi:MAG: transposase [Candidatus Thiodiazotropha sp. (ex Epidulcina cf. delphinae)]|nr:transposase [Candidatus Thiodiazotropha sp. (ex Epidulcina cf. delphinae)]